MKRIAALVLAGIMALSMMACGGNGSDSTTKAAETKAAETTAKAAETKAAETEAAETEKADEKPEYDDDVYEVTYQMAYILTPPGEEAVQRVEDLINDYMLNTLGITDFKLDLCILGGSDESTQTPMMLAGGEKLDIIGVSCNSTLGTYLANGYLLPLDDYLDNELAEAVAKVEDSLKCYYMEGHQYGIASWSSLIASYRWLYNKQMVEDAKVDLSGIDDFDDILDVLEDLKEVYPDEHFICNTALFPSIYDKEDHVNAVGTYTATIGTSTTLYNYFATEAFETACEKAYETHMAGLDDPEGSNQTMGIDMLTYSGSSKGVIMGYPSTMDTFVQIFNNNNTYGAEFAAVDMFDADMPNNWYGIGIPYTSENPSAAAKMINLIWTDEFIFNTLGYGIEGEDYVWVDKENKIVSYPEGMTQLNVPYNCYYKMAGLGDVRMQWTLTPGGTSKEDIAYYEKQIAEAYYAPAYGFSPNQTEVSVQVAAVANVRSQYYNALTYGEVDPDEYLPRFLEELKNAGIEDIVKNYQEQLDAWLAN